MELDWKGIGAQLATIGLPTLGTVIGTAVAGPIGASLGGTLGKGAAMAVAEALGVEATPTAVAAAIAEDPDGARVKLAQIDAEVKNHAAELADAANAREMGVALADKGWIGKTPAVLSYMTLAMFAVMTLALFFVQVEIPERLFQLLNQIYGAVILALGQMYGYWWGSSRASAQNSANIQNLTRAITKR